MNEAKLTARKLQMSRLGFLPADLSRKELQIEWKKLVKAGKISDEGHLMTRRSSRARPGRKKKGIRCGSCSNRLGEYHNHGLCKVCLDKQDAPKGMSIPKMSKEE